MPLRWERLPTQRPGYDMRSLWAPLPGLGPVPPETDPRPEAQSS